MQKATNRGNSDTSLCISKQPGKRKYLEDVLCSCFGHLIVSSYLSCRWRNMNMHYISDQCNTPYKNKIYEYSVFCRVEKGREQKGLCKWSEEPVTMLLSVNGQESRSSSGSDAKYSGISCMLQGSVGHFGNKIHFLSVEVIVLSQ